MSADERADAADLRWMGEALALAKRGLGSTYPNPCVGAIVVRDGGLLGAAHSAVTGVAERPSTSPSSPALTTGARRPARTR